jgi:uncharacterized protein
MMGWELAVIVVAISLGAFLKGMTGTGLPQIAIPIMAIFLGVERAVVVMAIPGVVTNAWLVWRYRHHLRETHDLPVMVVLGVAGAALGTMGLVALDARVLAAILAAVILGSLAVRFARPDFALSRRVGRIASAPVGATAGLLQGATGISGPLLMTYLYAFRRPKEVYVASITTLFLLYAIPQTVMLFTLGLYTSERLTESLLSLVPIAVALGLGNALATKMSSRAFDYCILAILAGSALKLLYDAVAG